MTEPTNDSTAVTVRALITARVPTPVGYVFRRSGGWAARLAAGLNPRGQTIDSPCLSYVVHHPERGTILIDTGMHPDAAASLRTDFGSTMSLLFRSLTPADEPWDAQLRAAGVDPDTVGCVVMTHLHVDHTSGMRLLPRATFVCDRREWEATRGRFASARGYVGHHLPPAARMSFVDLERDGVSEGPFSKTLDLLGDDSVRLIATPGHTAGHMSVLLRLAEGRQALLVGDAAYTLRSIDEGILPMLTDDDRASRRSMAQIKAFRDAHLDAVVVPTHDPDAWRALEAAGDRPGPVLR